MASIGVNSKEVLMDILLRLPPKPLVRFMCASKFLRDLICSSIFITAHFNRNMPRRDNIYLLCLHHPDFKRKLDDYKGSNIKQDLQWSLFSNETFTKGPNLNHPLGSTEHFGIYGSCNGVLCISDEVLKPKSRIHVWNPTVGKCRTVPLSITDDSEFRYIALHFGFHSKDDDYKVVRMMCMAGNAFGVEVYSLRKNSWELIEDVPVWLKCPWQHHRQSTFLKGVSYFMIEKKHIVSVVSFDSCSKEFEEFIVPDAIWGPEGLWMDIYKEQVCLLYENYCCEEEGMNKSDFWVLQEKRWTQSDPFLYPCDRRFHAMGISIDNELLITERDYVSVCEDLFLCNYKTREIRDTRIKLAFVNFQDTYLKSFFAIAYKESLCLLDY